MAACYRGAIATHLPNANHVVDRFHVVPQLMKILIGARRAAQRSERGQPHDPEVFKARFTLMRRIDRPQCLRSRRAGRPLRPPPPPVAG